MAVTSDLGAMLRVAHRGPLRRPARRWSFARARQAVAWLCRGRYRWIDPESWLRYGDIPTAVEMLEDTHLYDAGHKTLRITRSKRFAAAEVVSL